MASITLTGTEYNAVMDTLCENLSKAFAVGVKYGATNPNITTEDFNEDETKYLVGATRLVINALDDIINIMVVVEKEETEEEGWKNDWIGEEEEEDWEEEEEEEDWEEEDWEEVESWVTKFYNSVVNQNK